MDETNENEMLTDDDSSTTEEPDPNEDALAVKSVHSTDSSEQFHLRTDSCQHADVSNTAGDRTGDRETTNQTFNAVIDETGHSTASESSPSVENITVPNSGEGHTDTEITNTRNQTSDRVMDETGGHTASQPGDAEMVANSAESRRAMFAKINQLSDSMDKCQEILGDIAERQTDVEDRGSVVDIRNDSGMTNIVLGNENILEYSSTERDGGIMDTDMLDVHIEETKDVFVETLFLKTVEKTLEEYHHVTISGASGEGKTSTALMIGAKYRETGYRLVFVNDIDKFKLNLSHEKKLFLIFDDVFGSVGLTTDVPHLTKILTDLQFSLKKNSSGRRGSTQRSTDQEPTDTEKKMYVIFTTKSYNLECALPKLEGKEFDFFKGPSVLDVTRQKEHTYTLEEKVHIIQKYSAAFDFVLPADFEEICTTGNNMFGFPLTCKLFFELKKRFQNDFHKFFQEPLMYLKTELNRILDLMNVQAAALILMLLCDGCLNLHQLEIKSDNERLESNLKTVESVLMKSISRTDIARAARDFRGTFFTKGDVIGFAHPAIYDACACALYKINASLVLENCSLKFLYERVQLRPGQSTAIDDHLHIIYISEAFYDLIASRLAEGIDNGNISMAISHSILQENAIVDKMFQKLKLRRINTLDHLIGTKKAKRVDIIHRTNEGKYLLQWAIQVESLYLVEKILTVGYRFSRSEIEESLCTCSERNSESIMEYLLNKFRTAISPKIAKKLFNKAAEQENKCLVEMILTTYFRKSDIGTRITQLFSTNMVSTFKNTSCQLFQIACIEGNLDLAEIVVDFCDINEGHGEHSWTPIMNAVVHRKKKVFDMLVTKGADLKLTDKWGDTLLHLACKGGKASIVEHLLRLLDINSRGKNGWTPVMKAANSGKKEVIDLLVARGADLTLTDTFGDTAFHLVCQEGRKSIVEHLLSSFDINIRGGNAWTPVMKAAYSSKKEIFNLLVTKGADLTLTSASDYTVLHCACDGGNADIVKYVLPHFDINVRGDNGQTPLTCSVSGGHIHIYDILVRYGADIKVVDDDGDSILHLACEGGHLEMVKHVLSVSDINARDKKGLTPAMLAIQNAHRHIIQYLLDKLIP